VNINAPKLVVRGREYMTCRSGLTVSQSVGAARWPNLPKALKRLVFSFHVPNMFFNVISYVAVPAQSGQDYKKEVSRNYFFFFLQMAQKCIKPALMPQIKKGAFFQHFKALG